MKGLRVAGLLAMAFAIAHCGDSDVHVNTGVDPAPGTFIGVTDEGGTIEIEVGSIESITFECDGETISESFNPEVEIVGGRFTLVFSDGGRGFVVEGRFTSENNVEGEINDEEDDCDTDFAATRDGETPRTRTPTPAGTPGGVTTTPVDGVTATPVDGVTLTPGGPTFTPGGNEPTPTPTLTTGTGPTVTGPTATSTGPTPCPSKLTVEGQGETADLDTGTTGLAANQKVIAKGTLSVALNCGSGTPGNCTNCTVSGPIASTTVVNNLRQIADTSQTCTPSSTPGQVPSGCAYFFGAPLPLTAGSVQSCVLNRVNGTITGTANVEAGTGTSSLQIISRVVLTSDGIDRPCPRCVGSGGATIGFNQQGTCDLGARAGMPCTVHGTSSNFGNTSLDCPPSGSTSDITIALNPTTSSSSLAINGACAQEFPVVGNCYCSGQTRPNDCNDGTCETPNLQQSGTCGAAGPNDQVCSIDRFRGCTSNAECPKAGDSCSFVQNRACQGRTNSQGLLDQPIARTGSPSTQTPTLVSTFCIPQVAQSAINQAAGLPGPGALVLPTKVCYADSCSF